MGFLDVDGWTWGFIGEDDGDVEGRWIIIPFVLCVVPFPDKVSSPKSLLSHTKIVW